jgi:transcription factor SFP1
MLADITTGLTLHDEPKPFRCPVIGCENAYKNQNGLKHHKSVSNGSVLRGFCLLTILQHGHNNQRLHNNADGTFSIVNPETSAPYPGTMGMEKEKPYKCGVCGKR